MQNLCSMLIRRFSRPSSLAPLITIGEQSVQFLFVKNEMPVELSGVQCTFLDQTIHRLVRPGQI